MVFNKREIGYIKAIAGVGKHKSFIHSRFETMFSSAGLDLSTGNSRVNNTQKKCHVLAIPIHRTPSVCDPSDSSDDPNAWDPVAGKALLGKFNEMALLDCPMVVEGKEDVNGTTAAPYHTPSTKRVGTEFFLDKTHIRLRFTMPDFKVDSGKQPHHEYRLIIFRARKPQESRVLSSTGDVPTALHGSSYLNYWYDLFNGYVGRAVGIAGWRKRLALDGSEHYNGLVANGATNNFTTTGQVSPIHPPGEGNIMADDLMTMPLNDADYIVKCDERFFLGPEHGKSHYEKNVSFDWNQRGDTNLDDLAKGLDPSFNPLWTVMLIGTTNDTVTPNLNVLLRGTTSIESA